VKGPYERLKYDLRRVWECPECHHHDWTSGAYTGRWCACQKPKDGPVRAMRLIEDGTRRVRPAPAVAAESASQDVAPS
jgi:hypothetical protein